MKAVKLIPMVAKKSSNCLFVHTKTAVEEMLLSQQKRAGMDVLQSMLCNYSKHTCKKMKTQCAEKNAKFETNLPSPPPKKNSESGIYTEKQFLF